MARRPPLGFGEARAPQWPYVSERLVDFLEEQFPPKCKSPNEDLETHANYAGMVALIQIMRHHAKPAIGVLLDEDDDEALDETAVAMAERQQQEGTDQNE